MSIIKEDQYKELEGLPSEALPPLTTPVPIKVKEDRVVTTLKRVRERLKTNWTSGFFVTPDGNYCLVGAIQKETIGRTYQATTNKATLFWHCVSALRSRQYRQVMRAVRHELGVSSAVGVMRYNDGNDLIHSYYSDRQRRAEAHKRVIALLDRTIKEREDNGRT